MPENKQTDDQRKADDTRDDYGHNYPDIGTGRRWRRWRRWRRRQRRRRLWHRCQCRSWCRCQCRSWRRCQRAFCQNGHRTRILVDRLLFRRLLFWRLLFRYYCYYYGPTALAACSARFSSSKAPMLGIIGAELEALHAAAADAAFA